MFGVNKNSSPQDRIRKAEKSNQKLRQKRSKLDQYADERKYWKINGKIHENNVEIDIAKREMRQPIKKSSTFNTKINVSKNDNSKSVQLHGHYHNHKKK